MTGNRFGITIVHIAILLPRDTKTRIQRLHVDYYTGEDNSSAVPPVPQHLIRLPACHS